MDPSRCAILVPAIRYIEPHTEFSLRQLEVAGYPVRRLFGFSQIDVARNRLASDALNEGFDELMWIDADIAFEPASVERLRSHGLPISCGIYPKKGECELSCRLLAGTSELTFGREGGLIEIESAAAGFLHTRRAAFEAIQCLEGLPVCEPASGRPLIPFFLPMIVADGNGGHRYLGEDFAFSERLRRCGVPIVADTTIRLQHIGPYGYGWEDVGGGISRFASYTLKFENLEGEEQRKPREPETLKGSDRDGPGQGLGETV